MKIKVKAIDNLALSQAGGGEGQFLLFFAKIAILSIYPSFVQIPMFL